MLDIKDFQFLKTRLVLTLKGFNKMEVTGSGFIALIITLPSPIR
jgi:hypothetical protein